MTLVADGGATVLHYTVKATVGGKLAQIGQRLIDGAAKKMADDFFEQFSLLAGGGSPAASRSQTVAADENVHPRAFELPLWVPVGVIVAGFILLGIVLMH